MMNLENEVFRTRQVMMNNELYEIVKKMYTEAYEDEGFLDRLVNLNKVTMFSLVKTNNMYCAVCTYCFTNDYTLLENLVVDQRWRSNGIGSSFIHQFVTELCLTDGVDILLAAEDHEVALYRNLKCSIKNEVQNLFEEYKRKKGCVRIGDTKCKWSNFSCKDTQISYKYVFVLKHSRCKISDGCYSSGSVSSSASVSSSSSVAAPTAAPFVGPVAAPVAVPFVGPVTSSASASTGPVVAPATAATSKSKNSLYPTINIDRHKRRLINQSNDDQDIDERSLSKRLQSLKAARNQSSSSPAPAPTPAAPATAATSKSKNSVYPTINRNKHKRRLIISPSNEGQ
jgi:hypothetical protein